MLTFYWYPNCSTCRKARATLDKLKLDYHEIDLKTTPPTAKTIKSWFAQGDFPAKKFFNTSGLVYRELGLKDKLAGMSEDEMAKLLASDGMLIKRPIVLDASGKVKAIGFKQETYEEELA